MIKGEEVKGFRIQDAGAVSRENEGEEMNVREVAVFSFLRINKVFPSIPIFYSFIIPIFL